MVNPAVPRGDSNALTRRVFLGTCLASMSTIACGQPAAEPIRPEEFGARGNGAQDDAPAFAAAFAAASATGRPITLRNGARYVLGAAGWPGLRSPSGLTIEGNHATLIIAALPAQGLAAGIGNSAIRVDGGRVTVKNAKFELSRLKVMALALDRCDIHIEGCAFDGGDRYHHSAGLYLTRCSGLIRNNSGRDSGYLFYCGHTDAGMGSHNLRIADNRAFDLQADFVVGVIRDSVIENNECDGMFGGIGLAALAQTGVFCENVTIQGNTFSGFRAQGIQTDVWGETRDRNIIVRDNVLRRGAPTSSGIYMLRINGFEVTGNRIESCDLGIVVDAATDGVVRSNVIVAGGEHRTRAIGMVAANGDIRRIRILDNEGRGFHDGMMIEGQRGFTISDVEISGNRFADGQFGIRSTVGLNGVAVRDNAFRGNRQRDLEGSQGIVAGTNRHEDGGQTRR